MKKRFIPLILLLGVAALGFSANAIKNNVSVVQQAKADEKEIVYFNITSFGAFGESTINLNLDKTLPSTQQKVGVLYNGNYTDFWLNCSGGNSLVLAWSAHYPVGTNHYQHYRLDAGLVYYENATTRYVLEKDFNIWYTCHSGNPASYNLCRQENAKSFRITGFKGYNFNNPGYWHVSFDFEKDATAKSTSTWNGTPFYEAEARGEYTLYDWNAKDASNRCSHGADSLNTDATSGEWWIRIPYGVFNDATNGQDNKCRSFWLPRGTLFGGHVAGYPIYLENDVYFDFDGQWFTPEMYSTSVNERVYDPLDAFRTSLKMDDPTFDGDGTGACVSLYPAIKSTWNAFSAYQKKAFVTTDYYAPAFARLQAWVTANGDVLNGTSYVISANNMAALPISKNKENTIVIVIASMIMISSIGLFMFIKRKKYSK